MRKDKIRPGSVGIVHPREYTFARPPELFTLDSGRTLGPITVRYETYGSLNEARTNAVLILHALSGDAHAAGLHGARDKAPGWWDGMIGPGKAFDTERYFVVCANVLGGCMGTTGPSSSNPETGRPFGLAFPVVTIRDMVRVQNALIEHLGIPSLLAVVGGSMGGMQALEWAVSFPGKVRSALVLAATARMTAQAIAFNAVGRSAIMSDPRWRGGEYYGKELPHRGLGIARMIGHITYLSDESMHSKFGRRLRHREQYGFDFTDEFEVETYLQHQGLKFVERFDANSYLYITKAIDYFDLAAGYGSLEKALAGAAAKFLVVSYSSDWLYPSYQSRELVYALMRTGRDASYVEIDCPYGHDSFLLETERQTPLIASFLEGVHG